MPVTVEKGQLQRSPGREAYIPPDDSVYLLKLNAILSLPQYCCNVRLDVHCTIQCYYLLYPIQNNRRESIDILAHSQIEQHFLTRGMLYEKTVGWTFEEVMTGYFILYKRSYGDLDPCGAVNHSDIDRLSGLWDVQLGLWGSSGNA